MAGIQVDVVVVTCDCGMIPLDKAMHANAQEAWQYASEHVALNPDKCYPQMNRDSVPAALAPKAGV